MAATTAKLLMTPASPAIPASPADYKMPIPALGPCVWRNRPGTAPYAAVITGIGIRTVDLLVFSSGKVNGMPRSGCRHMDDPVIPSMVVLEEGCWDFTDETKARWELAARLDRLDYTSQ